MKNRIREMVLLTALICFISVFVSFPIDRAPNAQKKASRTVAPGSYPSAAIILLTDGRRTTGPDPLATTRRPARRSGSPLPRTS